MTFHFKRDDFNGAAYLPPLFRPQRPALYGLELSLPQMPDSRFQYHALRLIWTKINQGDTAVYDYRGNKVGEKPGLYKKPSSALPGYDPLSRANSQYECWLLLKDMFQKGAQLAAIYPGRDVAETKLAELEGQTIYGRRLPARIVKIS